MSYKSRKITFERYTFIHHSVLFEIDFDQGGHRHLEQFVLIGIRHVYGSSFPPKTYLIVAALDL